MQSQFELRFEGPKDDSPATLRQIKGVFVADLEFPASDVQRFIDSAPIVIKKAPSEEELKRDFLLLSRAGAKVIIEQIAANTNFDTLELEFEQVLESNPTELVPVSQEEQPALELNLSLDDFGFEPLSPDLSNNSEAQLSSENEQEFFNSLDLQFEDSTEQSKAFEDSQGKKQDIEAIYKSSNDLELIKPLEIELSNEINSNKDLDKIENNFEAANSSEDLSLEVFTPKGSTLFGDINNLNTKKPEKEESPVEIATTDCIPSSEPEIREINVAAEPANIDLPNLAEAPVIEMTIEQLKSLQTPKKKTAFKAGPVVILALAAAILLYINFSIFNSETSNKNPFDSLIQSLPTIADPLDSQAQKQLLEQQAADLSASSWYKADGVYPDRSYKLSAWVENSAPIHASFELSSPKPAPLSKEEIVNNIHPRPWLKRLEIKDLIFVKNNQLWTAHGPALAYLTIGDKNLRLTGKAMMTASLDSTSGDLEITISASSNHQKPLDTDQKNANILTFGSSGKNASELDHFLYTEKIILKKP